MTEVMVSTVSGDDKVERAKNELAKYFSLVVSVGPGLRMFSPFVDEVWHKMLEDEATYEKFCSNACGRRIGHQPGQGRANVAWVSSYEERFGKLDMTWFMHADGALDRGGYEGYISTGDVFASWDCSGSTNCQDPD